MCKGNSAFSFSSDASIGEELGASNIPYCMPLWRFMAYRFDLMPVRVDKKGGIVVRVIVSMHTWRDMILPSRCQACFVECIYRRPRWRSKSEMQR